MKVTAINHFGETGELTMQMGANLHGLRIIRIELTRKEWHTLFAYDEPRGWLRNIFRAKSPHHDLQIILTEGE